MKNGNGMSELVNQQKAAEILGMSGGGNIPKTLEKFGALPVGKQGVTTFWRREDVLAAKAAKEKVVHEPKKPANGGVLLSLVKSLQLEMDNQVDNMNDIVERVSDIERFLEELGYKRD